MEKNLIKAIAFIFLCLMVIFGIPYAGYHLIKAIADLDGNRLAANAGVIASLIGGGWYAYESMKESISERRLRRFSKSYDIHRTGSGAIVISDNPSLFFFQFPMNQNKISGSYQDDQTGYAGSISGSGGSMNLIPVIPVIQNELSIGIIGGQGTGKTTLLTNLLTERRHYESIYIIDPHGYNGKYPEGCKLVGVGRNYHEIDGFFKWTIEEMNRRYKIYPALDHPLSICIDELTLLHSQCATMSNFIQSALTEFRKIGMRLIFCCHSKRAKYLNLKGGYDLSDGICFVELHNDNGVRYAKITKNGQTQPERYALPEPVGLIHYEPVQTGFNDGLNDSLSGFKTGSVGFISGSGGSCSQTGSEEKQIIDAYKKTGSKNKTIFEVFGKKNRQTFDRVNDVLKKWGLI